jgi:hypothetical protein
MKFAIGNDVVVCNAKFHPAFIVKTLDTTKEMELFTCMDYYLDNVISNVPELAVALHSKGYIRGIEFIKTEDIPYIDCSKLYNTSHCQAFTMQSCHEGSFQRSSCFSPIASNATKTSAYNEQAYDKMVLSEHYMAENSGAVITNSSSNGSNFYFQPNFDELMFDPKVRNDCTYSCAIL